MPFIDGSPGSITKILTNGENDIWNHGNDFYGVVKMLINNTFQDVQPDWTDFSIQPKKEMLTYTHVSRNGAPQKIAT